VPVSEKYFFLFYSRYLVIIEIIIPIAAEMLILDFSEFTFG